MNNIVWLEFDLILNNCSGLDRSHRLWHNNNKKVAVRWPEENQTGIKGSSCLPVMSSQDISLEAESETWSTCQIKGIRKSDEKNQNYKRKRREGRKAIRGGRENAGILTGLNRQLSNELLCVASDSLKKKETARVVSLLIDMSVN